MAEDPITQGAEAITETAKAVQEGMKTARTGLELTGDFGKWLAQVLGRPIHHISGMFSDHLDVERTIRQHKLEDKLARSLAERNVDPASFRPVETKLALPAIQYAWMEDSDELRDMFANLLASAMDSTSPVPRTAFVRIIHELEPMDARILNYIGMTFQLIQNESGEDDATLAARLRFTRKTLAAKFDQIDETDLGLAAENLLRLGCVEVRGSSKVSSLFLTSFGLAFWRACGAQNLPAPIDYQFSANES